MIESICELCDHRDCDKNGFYCNILENTMVGKTDRCPDFVLMGILNKEYCNKMKARLTE